MIHLNRKIFQNEWKSIVGKKINRKQSTDCSIHQLYWKSILYFVIVSNYFPNFESQKDSNHLKKGKWSEIVNWFQENWIINIPKGTKLMNDCVFRKIKKKGFHSFKEKKSELIFQNQYWNKLSKEESNSD